jgi:dTDP-4-dehydrorhamnose reductase
LKILVLGASGMIGHRMWATLSQNHEVFGTLRRTELGPLAQIPGIPKDLALFGVDAYAMPTVEKALDIVRPQVVLNCIGIVKQLKDSQNYLKSLTLNTLFPHQLAMTCAARDVRMIQFSSDCVFDGLKGQYIENDFPNATDLYGRSKALGEVGHLKNVLTMRTSSIGREVFPHGGLLEWFLSNQGKAITGYSKAIYSGFPTHRLAKIISDHLLPKPELHGILHIASLPVDKLTLLLMIKEHFNLKIDIGENNTVLVERSLNCDLFQKAAHYKPLAWKDMLTDLEVDFETYSRLRSTTK